MTANPTERQAQTGLSLYTYFRSTAAYRVRIALNLKGLQAQQHYVHLLRDGGEQLKPAYLAINPQGLVPALSDGGRLFTQSLAIIEYLDEKYPEPPLLPGDAEARACIRALALAVACDIHPLNNLRVLRYLENNLHIDAAARRRWYHHWVLQGFEALEKMLSDETRSGPFCYGVTPTLADICVVPQVYNARRFECDLAPFPRIVEIEQACLSLPAFAGAAPERQADAG